MVKYVYDDIITAKDVLSGKAKKEDIIGKKGWLLDCIPRDMSLNVIARLGVHVCLTEIDLDSISPFGDGGIPFTYFLPEKEESATGTVIEEIGEKSYEERQDEWLKANDIAGGDKVRIVRRAESHEDGWDNTWPALMDDDVGKVGFVVEDNGDKGIVVDTENGHWSYPYFVLEKVKDEPEDAKPRFKVGDKVRIVKEWGGFTEGSKPTIGETGVIEWAGDAYIRVRLDSDNDWWIYSYDAVEPIEDESAYIPFDLSDPKDRDFLRGKWIKRKDNSLEILIDCFGKVSTAGTWNANNRTSEYLFGEYTFLDGSPVGKKADNK